MKRYIFGLIAVAIASASVAFTSPEIKSGTLSHTFYFSGNPLSSSAVEDENQWSITSPGNECEGDQNKACQIDVDENQTEMVNGVRKLKSTLNITATAGAAGSGTGYVPQLTTGISNRISRP